ncbi:Hsp20/alpha crystallin family protein [uncultured Ruminococcus sp.]|uniref:Hsp20/alpha crystallin family protein n=1 Tax=uncultured Ruminococcus sp. TaxID=165186 RepID=UPI000EED2871|nr:Hsp20/alpha crystallin family protein [uncultured Ruminococcus sp.]HCJ41814.1 heat-shock protein Hsp20 [Ruminococcus sp.]
MLLPTIFGNDFFDDMMSFPTFEDFGDVDRKLYGRHADRVMKTDVTEHDDRYEIDIDLPGFKKDELELSLQNGYLIVTAAKGLDKDEKSAEGKLIRQERYAGAMQRSYFVGKDLTEEEIKAKFENGVLNLCIPKKEPKKEIPQKKCIAIEG